jgi:hypothetical protein
MERAGSEVGSASEVEGTELAVVRCGGFDSYTDAFSALSPCGCTMCGDTERRGKGMGRVKIWANFLAWNGRFTFLLVFTTVNNKEVCYNIFEVFKVFFNLNH